MKSIIKITLFLVFAILPGFAGPVFAQNDPTLPDLAPREVEITGDLTISFPSLRRQPLIGFNPPPRVPDVPSDRVPFTAPYRRPGADIPPSPLRPPSPPAVSSVADRNVSAGELTAGVGRYFERFVRGGYSSPVGRATTLTVRGEYRGTNGYEPGTIDPSIDTASNLEKLSARLERSSGSVRFGLEGAVRRHAYSLYGASPLAGSLSLKDPSRTASASEASAWLRSRPGTTINGRLGLTLGRATITTDVFDPAVRVDPGTDRRENRLGIDAQVAFPIAGGQLSLEGTGESQGLDASGFPGNTISSGSSRIAYRTRHRGYLVTAGVRISGFDAAGQTPSGRDRRLAYLSPDIRIELPWRPGITFFVADEPQLARVRLEDLYRQSPFLMDEPVMQPVITPTHLLAGVRQSGDRIHTELQAGWKDVRNYRFVEEGMRVVNGYTAGYADLLYENASIGYLRGSLTLIFSPLARVSVDATYRDGQLDDSDTDIPYFSPFIYHASASVGLLDGRILLSAALTGEGSRYRNRAKTGKAGAVSSLSGEATWYVTPRSGIVAGVRSLGGSQEYWHNYVPESSVFYLGGTWRW